jgi:hypothetical protein
VVQDPTPYPAAGWMHASIHNVGGHIYGDCGVTLIAPQWVVTAQHCLYHDAEEGVARAGWFSASELTVDLGRSNLADTSRGGTYSVSAIVRQPGLDAYQTDPSKPSNDIALLKLSSVASGIATAEVYDACSASGSPAPGTVLNVVGWGSDRTAGAGTAPLTQAQLATATLSQVQPYRDIMVPGSGTAMFGDSGDGMFTMAGGQMVLYGLFHLTAADAATAQTTSWERLDRQSANASFIAANVGSALTYSDCNSVPTPKPGDKLPVAAFSWSRLAGPGNQVSLDGSASSDPDGTVTAWRWTSGGTLLGTGKNLSTSLGAGSAGQVTLTVTDNAGATASVTKALSLPDRAPVIAAVSPNGGTVPSTVPVLSVTASDPDADSLQYSFAVTGSSVSLTSGWTASATWAVPAHRLDPGSAYSWTVTARDRGGLTATRSSTFVTAMLPTAAGVVSTSTGRGYWQVASDGGVFSYGDAQFHGSLPGLGIKVSDIIGMTRTPDDGGYWLVGADGGVFAFGDAAFYGSMAGQAMNAPVVAMAPTKTGTGYWLVGADGGVFAFGNAAFYGSMGGKPLNKPVTAIAPTPSSNGYWLAAQDGGVFAFGDAPFYGSMGGKPLNAPVVDMDVTPDGAGYWLAAQDGGVFAFGDAPYYGSEAGQQLNSHITGMSVTSTGKGYWLNGCDGGIFAFGDAPYYGSNPTYECRGT